MGWHALPVLGADMSFEQFLNLLDQYGPTLDTWPAVHRQAAHELLVNDARAEHALGTARRVAQELAALPLPTPSSALLRRVAEVPVRNPRAGKLTRLPFGMAARGWVPLAALVFGLGAASGLFLGPALEPDVVVSEQQPSDEADTLFEDTDALLALADEDLWLEEEVQ